MKRLFSTARHVAVPRTRVRLVGATLMALLLVGIGLGVTPLLQGARAAGPAAVPERESIETQIARATASGKKQVDIEPGEYRRGSVLDLSGLDGFTLNAKGVTIVQTRLVQAVRTGTSNNLTVTGLTINYDPLPFTQGRVIGLGKTSDGKPWMDVRIDAGYPRPDRIPRRVSVYDPALRLWRSQAYNIPVTWQDRTAGVVRSMGGAWAAGTGDIVTFAGEAESGPDIAIGVGGANNTFKDVTLHTAPGFGFQNRAGEGNTHLDNFRVVPGPPPPGGTEKPILTTTWDAMGFGWVKKGPTVENSTVVGAGDDSMSVQGFGTAKVLKADGDTLWAAFADGFRNALPGDRLQQWTDGPTASIRSIAPEKDPAIKALAGAKADFTYKVTLDRPSPWNAGTDITNLDRIGSGFVFRNNRIDSSGRGFLVKARDGVIENNWMRGVNSISVTPENSSDANANSGGNLVIRGNTFTGTLVSAPGGWDSCQVGAVSFDPGSASRPLYPDITIEDNVFQDIRGTGLNLGSARNVTVRNNFFQRSHQATYPATKNRCGIPQSSVVYVSNSTGVTFEGNTIDRIGTYSVQQVTVDDRKPSGISGLPGGVKVLNPYLPVKAASTYTISNRDSGLLLAPADGSTDAGAGVEQQSAAGGSAQRWRLSPAGDNTVRIQNALSGLFLTGGSGSAVTQRSHSDDQGQRWRLLDTGNGTAKISNVATGSVLGATDPGPGSPAGQWPVSGALDQAWKFTDVSP
ncbi:RICIN domain-containing protein [Streptomyces sp. NPDC093099]|uniref:RICIN domain-containing protein n=1 Tax=Streptomyces sp. NPDC093099 TaxID=3366028 RepID=UPI0037F564B3